MRTQRTKWAAAAVWLAVFPGQLSLTGQGPAPEQAYQEQVRPYLKRYCVACHNARLKTAGVAVDQLTNAASIEAHGGDWEKILRKMRTGEMPPPGAPRAGVEVTHAIVALVGAELDRVAALKPDPGRVTVHRLNRAEYNNAVRDLLAVEFRPADDFPADDAGYGFDNIADVLSLPPVLMEKYLKAADRVSRMALGRVKFEPVLERRTPPRDVPQTERLNEQAPLASRGGAEIVYSFPADAEYLLRVRVRGAPDRQAPAVLDLFLDGERIRRFEVNFTGNEEDEEQRRFEARVRVAGGRHRVMAVFLRDDSWGEWPNINFPKEGPPRRNPIEADWIEVGGPFDVTGPGQTESRKRILSCKPEGDGEACAKAILGRLAYRAWRRPVTEAETGRLLRLYREGRAETGEFEGGLELALRGVLVSPSFLFRIERTPAGSKPGEAHRLNAFELASRLSFFLWSSIPDEALLRQAESGALLKREVLEAEARRMLADPRAGALTANFAGQWLHLRNLEAFKPNPELFPEYDSRLRTAMQREAELFFQDVVKADRSVLEFIDAKHTFLNERLAKFYGIEGVEGDAFRRVDLTDGRRGGVLTMGSVLAVTSYPTRTSPVIRGKWVLENLLGAPPPPPPPDVPELDEQKLGKEVSMRQQLAAHRANPSCASCHNRMDAIGFALENYDALGRYRTHDGAFAVDASGVLPSGESFTDAAGLKRIFRANPEEFVLCLTEKLFTYALGRGVERTDKPAIRAMARAAEPKEYRFSALVLGIVNSVQFQMRRAEGKEPGLGTDE
jgi:mono/diheme cytochrome c family protein